MDQIPKLAPRFRINARRRLIEQQELRFVQHASGKREPLFPAARELTCQLIAAVPKPHPLHHCANGLCGIRNAIDLRDEIKVLGNRQILLEAELLRHIADLAANERSLADDVMAKACAASPIGNDKTA